MRRLSREGHDGESGSSRGGGGATASCGPRVPGNLVLCCLQPRWWLFLSHLVITTLAWSKSCVFLYRPCGPGHALEPGPLVPHLENEGSNGPCSQTRVMWVD